MTPSTPTGSSDDVPADATDLAADIERRRAQLGETVEALSAKLDVKSRAVSGSKSLLDNAKRTTQERPAVVAGAFAGIVALMIFLRKVRHR